MPIDLPRSSFNLLDDLLVTFFQSLLVDSPLGSLDLDLLVGVFLPLEDPLVSTFLGVLGLRLVFDFLFLEDGVFFPEGDAFPEGVARPGDCTVILRGDFLDLSALDFIDYCIRFAKPPTDWDDRSLFLRVSLFI